MVSSPRLDYQNNVSSIPLSSTSSEGLSSNCEEVVYDA